MKVILTGATGYVGEGVLLAMLDDERIENVLSVGRRPCGHTHPKLKEYIVPDLLALKADDPNLRGYDVCFFIAGITSVGTPIDAYRIISHDIPVHFASILPNKKDMTYIYLSGAGTSDKGRLLWQQIKSSTERETQAMGFAHAYGWRPMFMRPYLGQTNHQVKAQKVVLVLYPLLRLLGQICTMKEMVNAMYRVATEGYPKSNLEPKDIISLQPKK
ncbi:MAG: hypothetical protein MJZ82_01995 [Paludibacteraceae bacterium]|nr:hypothetical protein [Paludibacteraceae bacterium]